jgi:isocitrate dehydrogenase (NAD+)
MAHTVCLIPGDGIGPEVTAAARQVIDASKVRIQWLVLPAGAAAAEQYGTVLPEHTVTSIQNYGVALKGPVTTPVGKGFKSVNVQLRQRLTLFAAVRPVCSLAGVRTRYEAVDTVVIRENTEGLYSGIENEIVSGVMQSLKIATRDACNRIARYAFEYAKTHRRRKVTVFHKANIMKMTDGLFLECARRWHEKIASDLEYEELIIDNGCMQMVTDPTKFDVLLLENLYGDLVSDLCAGLVGGLGVVPGANIGENCAVFEAVHGSAPDIAGKGLANPLAAIMSGVMLLQHLQEHEAADRIEAAYRAVLADGRPQELTRDIGGHAGTKAFTEAIIARMQTLSRDSSRTKILATA